jgi:hypothetical protein
MGWKCFALSAISGDQSYQNLTKTASIIPNKQAFIDFYGQLVNATEGYPNVLYEVWNEPHAYIYSTDPNTMADYFQTVVNPIIVNARASGAQQPFVMDGDWGGINITDYLPYVQQYVTDYNIVLSEHVYAYLGHLSAYGNPTDYNGLMNAFNQSGILSAAQTYPMYFGEIGMNWQDSTDLTRYNNILQIFHYEGWSWSGWWFRSLYWTAMVNNNGSPNAAGQLYQSWLNNP